MTDSQVDTEAASTTRRAMLAGAGAVGASALLAACGTNDDDGSLAGGDSGATNGSTPEAPTGAPTTGGAEASEPAGGGGTGTKLSAASAIPVEGGKVFADQQIVVTQPAKGEYKGFTAVCTHAGCTVANVKNGTINCGCHGSQFSIEDGSVKRGPAQQPLDEVQVKVSGGSVWLNA